jgi:hypothetical protein
VNMKVTFILKDWHQLSAAILSAAAGVVVPVTTPCRHRAGRAPTVASVRPATSRA